MPNVFETPPRSKEQEVLKKNSAEHTPENPNHTPPASFLGTQSKMYEAFGLYGKAFFDHWTKFWKLTAEGNRSLIENTLARSKDNHFVAPTIEDIEEMGRAGMNMTKLVMELSETMTKSWLDTLGRESDQFISALETATKTNDWGPIDTYWKQWVETLETMLEKHPEYIKNVKDREYGYQFENEHEYECIAETDRALLYRLKPLIAGVETDMVRKPIIIVSPFVLGDNISALLPRQGISYAHAYANTGAPTYVVHYKEILETKAVQEMTGEDFTEDLRTFTEQLEKIHDQPVALNGICQGGYLTLAALLTGKLDSHVDSLITCAMPVDLSRCVQFEKLRKVMPKAISDVDALAVTLPSGAKVIPGEATSAGMRWKNLARENPIASFQSEIQSARKGMTDFTAAIKIWLGNYTPMPLEIVRLSERSAITPLSPKGDLPIKLFGKKLNLKHLEKVGIRWHALIGDKDDVVELAAATAARDHLKNYAGYQETIAPAGHITFLTNPAFYPSARAPYEQWDAERHQSV